MKPTLAQLITTLPQQGELEWIGIRPARNTPMQNRHKADIEMGKGIVDDRFSGTASSKRQVTLIQSEHLAVIASCLGLNCIKPELLRRNLVVSGINLLALKNQRFYVGEVLFEMTGLCHPCSKMETLLGPGGYNAMRGHGGITAKVLQPGHVNLGDKVYMA